MFGKGGCGPSPFGGPGFGPMGSFGKGPGNCGPFSLLSELDLTDEQLLSVAALKGKTLNKMARSKLDMMELKKEAFKELAEQIKAHKSQCIDLLSDNLIAFSELLTPEQKSRMRLGIVKKFLGVDDILED